MRIYSKFKKWSDDTDLLEILRGGGVFLIIRLLGSAAAYFFAWYISIEYGPEGNGVLSFTLTSAVLLSAIFNLGLNTYAVRIIPQFIHEKNEGNVRKFYQTALRMIIRTMIAGSLILFLLSYIPSSKDLARDIRLFTLLALPLSILLFTSHVFRARKNILIFSLLQNNTLQGAALILLMIPLWPRQHMSEPAIALIITCLIAAILSLKNKDISAVPPSDGRFSTKKMLYESWPMLAGGISFMILNLTDRFMLRFLDTLPQLGIYDIALRISNLTLMGILAINSIAEPKFAELYAADDHKRLRRMVRRATFLGIGITLPVIFALAFFPKFWMNLFGKEGVFLAGTTTLLILLGGHMINTLSGGVLVLLNMTGQQRQVRTILLAVSLLNILLNALFIPRWSIEGAAWATMISTIIWNIWGVIVVRRKLGFWMWAGK